MLKCKNIISDTKNLEKNSQTPFYETLLGEYNCDIG